MRYFIRLGETDHAVTVVDGANGKQVVDEHGARTVSLEQAAGSYRVLVDGRVIDLTLTDVAADPRQGGSQTRGLRTVEVFGLGTSQIVDIISERDRPQTAAAANVIAKQRAITAQMPGRVVQVRVQAGQRVARGDALLVMEAMKMENELYADEPMQVVSVAVQSGDAVEMGATLLVVES